MDAPEIVAVKLCVSLAATLFLSFDAMLRGSQRFRGLRRLRDTSLVLLGVAGALGWWNYFQFGDRGFIQGGDHYHYYLGGKYFRELGYTRLYSCTAIAEASMLPPKLLRGRWIRDLETNRLVPIRNALAHPERCTSHFEPNRWQEFRRDLAWFLARIQPAQWRRLTMDHGPNAPPVWGLAGIGVANLLGVSGPSVTLASRIDPVLQGIMWLAVAWAFGWRVLCVALIFWGTNGLGEFSFLGGGYLRQDWLCATVVGLCALRKQSYLAAGCLLTLAALLRIFPAFLLVAFGIGTLVAFWRSRSFEPPRGHLRFGLGCLLTLSILVPLAAATNGIDCWSRFIDNIALHRGTPGENQLGLITLASYDPSNPAPLDASPQEADRWARGRREALSSHGGWLLAAWLIYGVLILRAAGRAPDWVVAALGVGGVFMFVEIAGYYYALLIALALLYDRDPWAGPAICAFAALTLLLRSQWAEVDLDFEHTAISALVLPLVLFSTWRAGHRLPAAPAPSAPVSSGNPSSERLRGRWSRSRPAGAET